MDKRNILSFLWRNAERYASSIKVIGKSHISVEFSGEDISVIAKERSNYLFKAAEITVDGRPYGGTVKIFEKLSEWYYFKKQYDDIASTVAIVVIENLDSSANLNIGDEIVVQITIPDDVMDKSVLVRASQNEVCRMYIAKMDYYQSFHLLNNLTFERIKVKCNQVKTKYDIFGDWETTFQYYLFDTIDIAGRNRDNFNELAKRVGVNRITSNLITLEQTEALLFGAAGLLMTDDNHCDYLDRLKSIYVELRTKYHIVEMERTDWFFNSKGRNISLHIEIARLAALLFAKISFRGLLFEEGNIKSIYKVMRHPVSLFWQKHIQFSDKEVYMERDCVLTDEKIDVFTINAIVPISYAMCFDIMGIIPDKVSNRITKLLESIKGEKNIITKNWSEFKLELKSALDSQAVIHLQKNYCNMDNCGGCALFYKMV